MSQAEIQRLLEEGQAAQQSGDATAASHAFERALAIDPNQPQLLNSLGMQALRNGNNEEARNYFRRAAKADPTAPELWINAANASRQMGDDAGELASLDAALAIDQTHFMARLRKADLLERTEQFAAAMLDWAAVVSLAAQADQLPPGIAEAVNHGRQFLETHQGSMAERIDASLAGARDGLSGADLRRFDACVDAMLGRRKIYRNECHGMIFPFLPADEFFDESHFPWLAQIEERTPLIRAELLSLLGDAAGGIEPYVNQQPGTPTNIWSELDGKLDWGAYFLWNYGERIDEACARCPETAAALDLVPRIALPGKAPTAFFSVLQPGKHIPPHTGVTNIRSIVHLPLIVPEGCLYRVGSETRKWVEGKAFVFDDTIEHEAWNNSKDLRAVLIFDVWNPHIKPHEQALVKGLFQAVIDSGYDPGTSEWR